jgi:hypothetical protein
MQFPSLSDMALSTSTAELFESLEDYNDVISWINDTLAPSEHDGYSPQTVVDLTALDQHITYLIATLDIACEDTSSLLERIVEDVSRGVPRLTFDLHFMKDCASSLQTALVKVHEKFRDSVPHAPTVALNHLQLLGTMKGHMEAAREVLREAESWSTLELEVTSLLGERSYTKAAERLSEASRSMVVFQNTPEYDPRRTLMVSLQNQLEASLSSALVTAINTQDVVVCRNYFSIFSNIQRESEFRNYYNGSRRASIVTIWQNAQILDSDSIASASPDSTSQTFVDFLPNFYGSFLSLLSLERTSIPSIFPDPPFTLSTLITSILSALQPTFSQRLSALFTHYGDSGLKEVIAAFRATEEFAASADMVMEKIKYSTILPSPTEGPSNHDATAQNLHSHARRRSTRMSMSWRSGQNRTPSGFGFTKSSPAFIDGLEWDQELFQPFLDFQVDYGSLERRLLEDILREIVNTGAQGSVPDPDGARLLREKAVDIFNVADESVARCITFTHGYGAVGLVRALDNFFQSFIDIWTADISFESSRTSSIAHESVSGEELSDLDYSAQDWSDFQRSLHLLASARAVYERMSLFDIKLRSSLVQIAAKFRLVQNDPTNFSIPRSRGEGQLLEQSPLNSAELHTLLNSVEPDPMHSRETFLPSSTTAGLRHNQSTIQPGSAIPLLVDARASVFKFAKACQVSLQGTILSPLRKHLASYASSPLWIASGDPRSKRTVIANDLQVPSFSLSPSDIVQRVAEGLLNLPRLFEVYADDDALSFSLHTLPHVDVEFVRGLSEQPLPGLQAPTQQTHMRRASLSSAKPPRVDPEAVSSAWLSSLGQNLLSHLTASVLPNIHTLTTAGAAQLASDLSYLSNIVRALNVEFAELEKWKEYANMDDVEGRGKVTERELTDPVLQNIARMRGWR